MLTRRRFLYSLGAVGGAGATLGAMEVLGLLPNAAEHKQPFRAPQASDFHLQGSGNDTTVLILGAGDAGLATAYELEKAGYRCEILEARSRPGGRAWTVRGGTESTETTGSTGTTSSPGPDATTQRSTFSAGQYMNAGPARIPQHHTTLDYCRELGVPIEVFVNANPNALIYRQSGAAAAGSLTGRAIQRRAAKADYTGYVSELLAKATNQGALDQVLGPDDREALLGYLRAVGVLGAKDRYSGSPDRGYTVPPGAGNHPGQIAAPFELSTLLHSGLGTAFPFELEWDQAMPMFQPVGGMDRIPFALAAAVRGPIRYQAAVQRIQLTGDGVAVDYLDGNGTRHRTSAEYCVCTIPPAVLRSIDSNLPADVAIAIGGLTTLSVGKIGIEFGRRFWEEDLDILGGITDTDLEIGSIFYPSYGYHGDRGVLIGYYVFGGTSDQLGAMTPLARQRFALGQGARIHGPVYRSEFASAFSVHWQQEAYNLGGWVVWSEDRGQSASYQRLIKPVERLYFAGDHLSYVTAWQHGAFESARYVVTALHQRVLSHAGAR